MTNRIINETTDDRMLRYRSMKTKWKIDTDDILLSKCEMDELIANAGNAYHQFHESTLEKETFERKDEFERETLKPTNRFIEEIKRRKNK